ncbi:hypothetical protein ABIB90_008226 [Bradyrhizobium sp. JR4.1]
MLNDIETYLALRRTTGFAMSTAEYLLKSFAAFAAERGQTYVETKTARLGRARTIRRARRCTAKSRLSLRTPCPGGGRRARAAAGPLRRP